jgi:hypothetical protein
MANQPTPRTIQPPPDLPSMPDVSTQLSSYLRNFSLWCRHGFADKPSINQPLHGLMFQAIDAPAGTTPEIWMLQVRTGGAFVLTQMPLGGGKP